MPLLNLLKLSAEGGQIEDIGELSCEYGESFAQFRVRLDGLQIVDFLYDFWVPRLGKRMLKGLEKGNVVDDHKFQVTIIPSKSSISAGVGTIMPRSFAPQNENPPTAGQAIGIASQYTDGVQNSSAHIHCDVVIGVEKSTNIVEL